jgi:hypothetical protein
MRSKKFNISTVSPLKKSKITSHNRNESIKSHRLSDPVYFWDYMKNGLNVENHVIPLLKCALLRTITCWSSKIKIDKIHRGLSLTKKGIKSVGGLLGAFNSGGIAKKNNSGEWISIQPKFDFPTIKFRDFPPEGYQAMRERAKSFAEVKKNGSIDFWRVDFLR